ncbi:MAG TPA: DUF2155 domain-containing protein [Rhizomicrobium sp.]
MIRAAALGFSASLLATAAVALPAPPAAVTKPVAAKPATQAKVSTPAPVKQVPLSAGQQEELALLNTAIPDKSGVKRLVILRGLDKLTGRPANILAPIGVPVKFATMMITARYCYSTPISEPPETTAFLQIEDHRPDQSERAVFSGWMLASSPSLNGLQHPLYDVRVINCTTNQPGQILPAIASTTAVKAASPDATAKEALPELPEGAGQ